jgi:hypothetical protein
MPISKEVEGGLSRIDRRYISWAESQRVNEILFDTDYDILSLISVPLSDSSPDLCLS